MDLKRMQSLDDLTLPLKVYAEMDFFNGVKNSEYRFLHRYPKNSWREDMIVNGPRYFYLGSVYGKKIEVGVCETYMPSHPDDRQYFYYINLVKYED